MQTSQKAVRRGPRVPPLGPTPLCTIVIPCFNEEHYIEAALRGAMAQRYPADRLEILVVDGRSTDRTREVVQALQREDPRVRLLDNPRRYQSAGMNAGIAAARGEVIIRMDAHAEYAPDYVEASVRELRRTGALNVGGAARVKHRGFFQRAIGAALSSPLGAGGSPYRDPRNEGFVESVFNGAFRREAFEIAGLYDPEAITNEDAELNQRILQAGGAVYLSRRVVVHYYPRSSLPALARQYFAYGQGRARTLLKHRRALCLRPMMPFFLVTGAAVGAAAAALHPPLATPLGLAAAGYGLGVLLEAARVGRRSGLELIPALAAIFPTMHLAHGTGFWYGLIKHRGLRGRVTPPERLAPRRSRASARASAPS